MVEEDTIYEILMDFYGNKVSPAGMAFAEITNQDLAAQLASLIRSTTNRSREGLLHEVRNTIWTRWDNGDTAHLAATRVFNTLGLDKE